MVKIKPVNVIYVYKVAIGVILSILILAIIIKLCYYIFELISLSPLTRFEAINIKNMLGDLLLLLVLIELLRTVYVYITQQDVYLNALLEAAFVAVLRKVIISEVEHLSYLDVLSYGALTLVLAYIYYKLVPQNPQ